MKFTVDQIRTRFDQDVERFSNLETAQTSIVDSRLFLDLISQAAAAITPGANDLLDIGCGAGNYSLKMLQILPDLNITLIDLSQPMLTRAVERLSQIACGRVFSIQGDIREVKLGDACFDILLAGAVFHHLRTDEEWQQVFAKCYAALRHGGSLWIADLIEHDNAAIQVLMKERYGEYLFGQGGEAYRANVFQYIEQEDTPRSLVFQLDMLRTVGFRQVEVLHKNCYFAAFGAIK